MNLQTFEQGFTHDLNKSVPAVLGFNLYFASTKSTILLLTVPSGDIQMADA